MTARRNCAAICRPPGMNAAIRERRRRTVVRIPQSDGNGAPALGIGEVHIAEPGGGSLRPANGEGCA